MSNLSRLYIGLMAFSKLQNIKWMSRKANESCNSATHGRRFAKHREIFKGTAQMAVIV